MLSGMLETVHRFNKLFRIIIVEHWFLNLLTVILFCLGAYQRQLSPAAATAQTQDLYATW